MGDVGKWGASTWDGWLLERDARICGRLNLACCPDGLSSNENGSYSCMSSCHCEAGRTHCIRLRTTTYTAHAWNLEIKKAPHACGAFCFDPKDRATYQIFTCFSPSRTIVSPVLHWNA